MKKLNLTINAPTLRFLPILLIHFLVLACSTNAFNQTKNDTVAYKTGYVSVNGAKLFYKEAGQGQPACHRSSKSKQKQAGEVLQNRCLLCWSSPLATGLPIPSKSKLARFFRTDVYYVGRLRRLRLFLFVSN
jgi:hypothetical protein